MPDAIQDLSKVLRAKLRKIAEEFANGEINTEQFHTLYERYQTQLNLLSIANDPAQLKAMSGQEETVHIRTRLMGKALSLAVYHHATGRLIDKIGDFTLPLPDLMPILNPLLGALRAGKPVEPRVQPVEGGYALFVAGKFSTTIMVFNHEPNIQQVAAIAAMHGDFEVANAAALGRERPEEVKLASPFISFVMKTLQKKG
jgi:hypothetical protein